MHYVTMALARISAIPIVVNVVKDIPGRIASKKSTNANPRHARTAEPASIKSVSTNAFAPKDSKDRIAS